MDPFLLLALGAAVGFVDVAISIVVVGVIAAHRLEADLRRAAAPPGG